MRFSTIFGIIVLVFALFGTVMVIGSDNMIGYDSDTWHDDYSTDSLTSTPKVGDCYSYTEKVTYSANKDLNKRIEHELLIKSAAGSTFEVSDSGTGEDFSLTAEEYRKYIVSESFIKVQGLTDKTSEKTTTLKTAFGKKNVYCDTYSLPDTEELHYQTYKIWYGEEGVLYKVLFEASYRYLSDEGYYSWGSTESLIKLTDCNFFVEGS